MKSVPSTRPQVDAGSLAVRVSLVGVRLRVGAGRRCRSAPSVGSIRPHLVQ